MSDDGNDVTVPYKHELHIVREIESQILAENMKARTGTQSPKVGAALCEVRLQNSRQPKTYRLTAEFVPTNPTPVDEVN